MTVEELVSHFPQLYHMAECGSWDSIKKHGLLSTTALLDLFEIDGDSRRAIESDRRLDSVTIHHPLHGTAVIRDQKPLSEGALRKCLNGMVPHEWYLLLNGKTFFWPSEKRLLRLLGGRVYRDRQHCVIAVDTAELASRHEDRITLSPINSGAAIFNPQPRGRDTFRPISAYPFHAWCERRKSTVKAVAEVAVEYSVPDIAEIAVRVEHRTGDRLVRTLWHR